MAIVVSGKQKKPAPASQRGTGAYKYISKTPKNLAPYAPSQRPQDVLRGKDISAAVDELASRNGGFSASVSRGKRPAHRQGSWKRA